MSRVIHGEIHINAKCMGQVCDLMSILVTNGYTVEIGRVDDFTKPLDKIVVIFMTEEKLNVK